MRWTLILVFLWALNAEGQIRQTWVGDTSKIRVHVMSNDTFWFPKLAPLQNVEWYVYFDSEFTRKAAYYRYGQYNCDVDTTWFRNGKIRSWQAIGSGCITCPTWWWWYANGELKMQTDCISDTCTSFTYYPSGKIETKDISYHDTTDFPNDLGWHVQLKYYENGQKKFEPVNPRLKGSQPFIAYFETGQKKIETTMFNYVSYIGSYAEWHANGQLMCSGQYAEFGRKYLGIPATDKEGKWSYYSESGKLIKEEFYEEGKLVNTVNY
ncbi:MAG TPA: hypothetical protein VK826_05535 [Bacteroidia bacterium]|nr:hypothetical protein [Bacteroidia bacterium]